jgi:ribonuclease D
METVLIQINDKKAYKLLEDLEDLQVIKVLKKSNYDVQSLSEKFGGKLPSEVAEDMQEYITRSRKEWGNRDI